MVIIRIEFPDGKYEDIEITDEKMKIIQKRCEYEGISIDEYISNAITHYAKFLSEGQETLRRLCQLEQALIEEIEWVHEQKKHVRTLLKKGGYDV